MTGAACLALLCDRQGAVLEIIRDDQGLAPSGFSGALDELLAPESRDKAGRFLDALAEEGAVAGWEMLPAKAGLEPLHFAGGLVANRCVVLAMAGPEDAARVHSELLSMHNEQVNFLRQALKEQSAALCAGAADESMYEEFSRVNNELVNAQRELHKKRQELEYLNEQKNVFLGMAAHDLRNPLGVLMSLSSAMEEELQAQARHELARMAHTMHTSSRFMLQLVNQFLDVAKIESGRLDLYLEPTDLHSLFRDAVDLNRVLAERKAVALEYAFDSIPETMADRGKLVQVLNNLVSNAVKYAPAESTVQVGLRRHGDGAVLSVADQGQGIAAEDVERIFRVFTRLDDGDGGQDPEHSVGLGLAIVKRIVQGHGGRLWLESEPGRGTTFFALIPLVEPREREQAPTPPPEPEAPAGAGRTGEEPPEAPAAGRTVMVVDDERINAHIVLRLLHKAGHHGVWAASGRACLELLRGRPCDLVFMDVQMAGMDGVETLRRIRAGEAGEAAAAIPVAGLTGHTDPETRRRLLDAGMVAVLAKPVDAAGLLEAVEEHAADPGEGGR